MNDDTCYAALTARDARFDGLFFVAVHSTGIYCRPVCTARTPSRHGVTFFPRAAGAEKAGFRACFRCRPEIAPGHAPIDALPALVAQAVGRIEDGALNFDGSVDDIAAELGVTARHLRRAFEERLGVSPVELAQVRRLALAKALLQDTQLGLAEVAFASGFASLRRFNAAFQERMGRAPSTLRREHGSPTSGASATLRLDYRAPYDAARLLRFLAARAIPGVESVSEDTYRRIVHFRGLTGTIAVRFDTQRSCARLDVSAEVLPALMPLVTRVRRLFDLDAQPDAIVQALAPDPIVGPSVLARPGLRLPGAIDPFEAGVRALLGQQVSVRAATTLAGRFAERFGTPFDGGEGLSRRFPTAIEIASRTPEELRAIGLTEARSKALHGFACAVSTGHLVLRPGVDLETFVAQAVALPGIGPWTAHYLAMRALHHPDAFPASDLGVRKALADLPPKQLEARAEAWRPWRSYAVIHLWTALSEGQEAP